VNNGHAFLCRISQKNPDSTAVTFNGHNINYQALNSAVNRLAAAFAEDVNKGERIALMLPNIPHFIISYYALLMIGAVVVPVSAHQQAAEIAYRLKVAGVRGIIYWHQFREQVKKAAAEFNDLTFRYVLGPDREPGEKRLTYLIETHDPLCDTVTAEPDQTAQIVFTSGPEGEPVGVELTHANIYSNGEACRETLQLNAKDAVVSLFPLSHPVGHILGMSAFLRAGGKVVMLAKNGPADIIKAVNTEQATYLVGVPPLYNTLVESADGASLSTLKYCLSTGDALNPETMRDFEDRFKVPILEGYGLTEATAMVSFNSTRMERKPGSIGLPIRGVDLKIVDESGEEIRPGQDGEIIVQGPNVMKGYLKEEQTKKVLRDGWLYTGDIAKLHDNGYGFIVVRKKDVIVKGGFNIYPREVENILGLHPKVKEVVVLGVPHASQGEEIHACVVLNQGVTAAEKELIDFSREQMAAYKCPGTVHFMTSLPVGPTGKGRRQNLLKQIRKTAG